VFVRFFDSAEKTDKHIPLLKHCLRKQMIPPDPYERLAEAAEAALPDTELERWLADHPDAAIELEIARRVRALMVELRAAQIATPDGFEERLMAQIRNDTTLLQLLDFGLAGFGEALLALADLLFGLLPAPETLPA
jgi:hypothetical protein